MSDTTRQCKGKTRSGRRCERRFKAAGDFCGLHSGRGKTPGAPKGNRNARTHGFYSALFTDDEIGDLAAIAAADGLADEIALLRIRLQRAVNAPDGADLDTISRACGRITSMLKAQRILVGEAASEFERAMAEVLDSVAQELGLSLE